MISLPLALQNALHASLRDIPSSKCQRAATALSERYRAQRTGDEFSLARGADAALGYAAIILPAAYAQLYGAMAATAARLPAWQPVSMLDIGSGPGTALWAATEQWSSLSTFTAWEREPAFIDLGRRLAKASKSQALRDATWHTVTLGKKLPDPVKTYDLIVFGHVLNELPQPLREEVVTWTWQHCSGVLLIVEPGTSTAFPIVRALREHLLRLAAPTLAPCTHDKPCPLLDDWCHFPQRLERPAFQRRAKAASAGWEESKFSYAAMSRLPAPTPAWGRLIHQPNKQKQQVNLSISSTDGIIHHVIPKRNREAFRTASKHDWGDILDAPLA